MRITSRGQVMFEVDAETNSAMAILLREIVGEMLTANVQSLLIDGITTKIMEEWSSDSLAERVARYIPVPDMVDYLRRDLISHMLSDERFNARLMRTIGDATIGVTNEAVERVTAIIQAQTTTNGDV